MRRPRTHNKRPNVISTLFIIGVLNGKGRRIAEVNREAALNEHASRTYFHIDSRRMKLMVSPERNVPTWEAVRYRGRLEEPFNELPWSCIVSQVGEGSMCSWVGISSVWLVGTNQFLMVGPRHSHHILLGNEAEGEDDCFPATAGDALYAFGQSEEEDACFPATAGDALYAFGQSEEEDACFPATAGDPSTHRLFNARMCVFFASAFLFCYYSFGIY